MHTYRDKLNAFNSSEGQKRSLPPAFVLVCIIHSLKQLSITMHVVDGFLEKIGPILSIIHANQKMHLIFLVLIHSRLALIEGSRIIRKWQSRIRARFTSKTEIAEQHSSKSSKKPSIMGWVAVRAL